MNSDRTSSRVLAALSIVLPVVYAVLVVASYVNPYSETLFTEAGFSARFGQGVYRFRILGPAAVKWLAGVFRDLGLALPIDQYWRGPGFDRAFSSALIAWNTAGLVASSIVLMRYFTARLVREAALLWYVVVLTLIVLSMWVVTPYDTWSYFFIVAAIAAFHSDSRHAGVWLVTLMVLGTLTRETQALCLAYAVAWTLSASDRQRWGRTALAGVAFATCYLGLRVIFGFEKAIAQYQTFPGWISNPLAVLTFIAAAALLWATAVLPARSTPARQRAVWIFHAASLPYWTAIVMTGLPREFRLFVPLILAQALLVTSHLKDEAG